MVVLALVLPIPAVPRLMRMKVSHRLWKGLEATADRIWRSRTSFSGSSFSPVSASHFILSDIRRTVSFFNDSARRGDQAY